MKISSTLLSEFKKVQNGELCGLIFEQRFIHNNPDFRVDSPEIQNGNAFEYSLTGGCRPEVFTGTKTGLSADAGRLMQHVNLESFDGTKYEKSVFN